MGFRRRKRGMVMASVFHQGDIIDLDFDPRVGHEQSGSRPAMVVSRDLFHTQCGLLVVCPITSKQRRSPFHVPVSGMCRTSGYIMCDQMRTIDPSARNARVRDRAPVSLLMEVSDVLIGIVEVLDQRT